MGQHRTKKKWFYAHNMISIYIQVLQRSRPSSCHFLSSFDVLISRVQVSVRHCFLGASYPRWFQPSSLYPLGWHPVEYFQLSTFDFSRYCCPCSHNLSNLITGNFSSLDFPAALHQISISSTSDGVPRIYSAAMFRNHTELCC